MSAPRKRIVIAGGSGFIGSALTREFRSRNYEIVILTRKPREWRNDALETEWDGKHIGEWVKYLNGAEAVINLAGKNINAPFEPNHLREVAETRIQSVRAISVACAHVAVPPRVWVQASAIGFYGNRHDESCDEKSLAGDDALAEICKQWEGVFNSATVPKIRKVLLRIGFVLGRSGGALPVLSGLTRLFLGGRVGHGKQFISWIHIADLAEMFVETIENPNFSGTYNATAPNPVTNKEFMRELRHALHRPWTPPAPEWAVKFGSKLMNSEPSLALDGCRVVPKRFLDANFPFLFSQLRPALKNLYP
ncbi:MAG TPA: TIGR01777 family oxidoreductase [Verrucomicrobiae bacterium]|nr:TIGR01777 family oxidoreductase [Verrucomicrobiae bacterium]